MSLIRPAIASVFVLALSGCATGIDPQVMNSADYPAGYADGCSTANKQSNGFQSDIVENQAKSSGNEAYIVGWRQGFYACGGTSSDPKRYNHGEWYHDIGD